MPFTQGHIFVPRTYNGDLDGSGHALVQKMVWEFDQDGVLVRKWPIEPYLAAQQDDPAIGGAFTNIAINNDKIYILYRRPNARLYELSPDGSVRVLYDFINAPDDTQNRTNQCTFDSEGHVYVLISRVGGITFPQRLGVIYKIHKDTGILLQRWTFHWDFPSNIQPYDSIWLMEDDKILLLGNTFSDGWEGLLAFDLSQGQDLVPYEYGKVRSPYDAATFGYYFDIEDVAVIDGHAYVTIAPEGFGHNYDAVPITRVGPGEVTNQPMYFTGNLLFGGYEDEGFAIDCDPDGQHIWVASQSSDTNSLYKFNKNTGELIKIVKTYFDHGNSLSGANPSLATAILFAIAGGSGHHGCGCCTPVATTPFRVIVTLVGAT